MSFLHTLTRVFFACLLSPYMSNVLKGLQMFFLKVPLYVRLHEILPFTFRIVFICPSAIHISPIYTHKPSLYVRSCICLLHVCPYISAKFYTKPYIDICPPALIVPLMFSILIYKSVCTTCLPPLSLTKTAAHLIELINWFNALYIRDSYVFTVIETGGLPSKLACEVVTRRVHNFRFLLSRICK
jgi:hypothetical protein